MRFFTLRELELSGIKNGMLITYCVENKFDILLTIDKNLMHQQNLDKYPVTIVVLNCFTSKIEELITFLPSFKLQVDALQKNKAYIIDKKGERITLVQAVFGVDRQLIPAW